MYCVCVVYSHVPVHVHVYVPAYVYAFLFLCVSRVSQLLEAPLTCVASHILLAAKRDDVDQETGQEIIK